MLDSHIKCWVRFITQDSKWEKWAIDKYAHQMMRELRRVNIPCSVSPVIWGWSFVKMLFEHLFMPLVTGWKLLFCKEKIIYLHYDFFAILITYIPFLWCARFLFWKKIIVQVHEYWENQPYKKIVKIVDLAYCSLAHIIIVHNTEQLQVLKSQGFKNIEFLPMPIDDYVVQPSPDNKQEVISILMHGAIIRKKWYEIWIQALWLLPAWYHLTLVGGIGHMDYYKELIQNIKSLHLENRITIINRFLPDEEYLQYIKAADIIIYPYLISTASAALSEGALKFEKPFLTSNLDSFVDYLGTEEYSFMVGDPISLAEKIRQLDMTKATQFSIVLKETYNWNKVWIKLSNIFTNL